MSPLPPASSLGTAVRPLHLRSAGAVEIGVDPSPTGRQASAALELELRQLTGVVCVSLADRGGLTLVELAVDAPTDTEWLRSEARRISLGHVDGPVVIDVVAGDTALAGSRAERRVRLLVNAVPRADAATGMLLEYGERQVAVLCDGARERVANGLIDGLHRLGFEVPFEVVEARGLPEGLGSGTLVLICETSTGTLRRGLANGRNDAESTARAVLHALNRVLHRSSGDCAGA